MSDGLHTQSDSAGGSTGTARMPYLMGCTFAQPGKYDRIAGVRRRCGFTSNYFDQLRFYVFARLLVPVVGTCLCVRRAAGGVRGCEVALSNRAAAWRGKDASSFFKCLNYTVCLLLR